MRLYRTTPRSSKGGEILLITHAEIIDKSPYFHRPSDWELFIDEVFQPYYAEEVWIAERNHDKIMPALKAEPFNLRYDRLVPNDDAFLRYIAENPDKDQFYKTLRDFANKLLSHKWNMYVLSDQFAHFASGEGRMFTAFGLFDPKGLEAFKSVTLMGANLEHSILYHHLIDAGYQMMPHELQQNLKLGHPNGYLVTVYLATDGNWSKGQRDKIIKSADGTATVMSFIVSETIDLFRGMDFVKSINKPDLNMKQDPFGGLGTMLPHKSYGLNTFQNYHQAVILPALNPTPALYRFLDEVSHISSEAVRRATYWEAVYQGFGRISIRNKDDNTPVKLVVADKPAADMIALMYPGAKLVRMKCADQMPQQKRPGRTKKHETSAEKNPDFRNDRKKELTDELDCLNERNLKRNTLGIKVISAEFSDGVFGGSLVRRYLLDTCLGGWRVHSRGLR